MSVQAAESRLDRLRSNLGAATPETNPLVPAISEFTHQLLGEIDQMRTEPTNCRLYTALMEILKSSTMLLPDLRPLFAETGHTLINIHMLKTSADAHSPDCLSSQ